MQASVERRPTGKTTRHDGAIASGSTIACDVSELAYLRPVVVC